MPFGWTLNPYRGCEMACKYCFARYTHEFLGENDPVAFERRIYVKLTDRDSLVAELTRARKSALLVALGTATDPYQPAETQFQVTRRVLEAAAKVVGVRLSITTKSTLVRRDLALLRELAAGSEGSGDFSIPTPEMPPPRREARAPAAPRTQGVESPAVEKTAPSMASPPASSLSSGESGWARGTRAGVGAGKTRSRRVACGREVPGWSPAALGHARACRVVEPPPLRLPCPLAEPTRSKQTELGLGLVDVRPEPVELRERAEALPDFPHLGLIILEVLVGAPRIPLAGELRVLVDRHAGAAAGHVVRDLVARLQRAYRRGGHPVHP